MWDIEPDTYYQGDAELITKYTLDTVKPGSIILLHPFYDSGLADKEALPRIIDGLVANGYKFVTINQMLKYKKYRLRVRALCC
jgi:peptidoglycan-N-acetylglucosamine deacetylase